MMNIMWLSSCAVFSRANAVLKKTAMGIVAGFFALSIAETVHATPAQTPLFLSNPVVPLVMLNMSKDHQLYMKLYDDYSDLTGDGNLDLTYVNSYSYYGYFDSKKCYSYSSANGRFEPAAWVDATGYCDGTTWSGNFLNWSTMTRMDAVRKILYGGYRSKDDSETVLERVFLPHDAHSFVKYYNGTDANKLIPTSVLGSSPMGGSSTTYNTGISICNTTHASSGMSQTIDTSANPPLLRIAKGNFSLWSANERWQCTWNEEHSAGNSNNATLSGIYAFNSSPKKTGLTTGNGTSGTDALGSGDYNVRVQVCKNTSLQEDNCYAYPNGYLKPRGLLQKFGENFQNQNPRILFGLITGSFSLNKSGGVLRKNISDLSDEINSNSGVFTAVSAAGTNQPTGIVATLNMLRIRGYSYTDGTYLGSVSSGGDNCPWQMAGFSNGQCTNWGNPQSEIYLQALRYFAGVHGSSQADPYETTDNTTNTGINKLPKIAPNTGATPNYTDNTKWKDPLNSDNYCAPLNIIQFNATVSSYDNDELAAFASQISGNASLATFTDALGDSGHENFYGKNYFVGNAVTADPTGTINLCTAKNLTALSLVTGTCPDAPHLKGTYNIAGMAYYARQHDMRSDLTDTQTIRTYGVELAPAIPSVTVPVPGNAGKTIKILPACANHGTGGSPTGNCGLVSFRVVSQSANATTNTGLMYVNWEESEQGGDFDQDMWGVINYTVTATGVTIITKVLAQSTSSKVGFGYILSGTSNGDGFHAWSGINGFTYPMSGVTEEAGQAAECNNCQSGDGAVTKSYTIGVNPPASFLDTPLKLAAKWGGYSKDFETSAQNLAAQQGVVYNDAFLSQQIKNRDTSDTYYYATDPYTLQDNLDKAFTNVANDTGSAASVATNSARLSANSYLYQAQFRSGTWDGSIKGYTFDANGGIVTVNPLVTSVPVTRTIYIKKGTSLAPFTWANLPNSALLRVGAESTDTNAQKRLNWITGSATDEYSLSNPSGILRSRTTSANAVLTRNVIGDIVDSSPAYVGGDDYRYDGLPGSGSSYRSFVAYKNQASFYPRLFVGANDGMMHAFRATDLVEDFAYVSTTTFPKMANLSGLDYGKSTNPHQYLVDGPIVSGDAYIGGAWRSIVVGTSGAGGTGVFALDVTDPATPTLLWEISSADMPAIGNVMGKPIILPLRNGRWGVIFGNGDAGAGTSKLVVLDLEDPLNQSKVIDTGIGRGLSSPAVLVDDVGRAVAAYAGDLSGNLFSFDLSSSSMGSWSFRKMFVAVDAAGHMQSITAAPTVGINQKLGGAYMVYFGTGKYFESGDNIVTASQVTDSFYAIPDNGNLITRSNLMAKTITQANGTRTVSTDNPDWTTQVGWYADFSLVSGERITTKALLIQDKLIFPTLIPSTASCLYGGTSWLMEIPAVGDKFVNEHLLDDGMKFNSYLILAPLSYGVVSSSGGSGGPGGPGGNGAPPGCSGDSKASVLSSASDGSAHADGMGLDCTTTGRQSWRQVK